MAWTTTDLDAVKAALAKGEQTVQFADRSVTYRSVDDLLRVKQEIEAELAAADSRPRQFHAYTRKGL
jgi:hypothetical protein